MTQQTIEDFIGIPIRIVPLSISKVLDISGGSAENSKPIIIYDYHAGYNQIWTIEKNGDFYVFRSMLNPDMVFDIQGGSTADKAALISFTYHGGDNQLWSIDQRDDGSFVIKNKKSGKVLDVTGSGTTDGTQIIQFGEHDGPNQRFAFSKTTANPIDDSYLNTPFVLGNKKSLLVGDISGASSNTGGKLIQWKYHAGYNQIFELQNSVDGYYSIVNINSGLCLQDSGNGAGIVQENYSGADDQLFSFENQANGFYVIRNKATNLVFDIRGGSLETGAEIIAFEYHGGDNQQFSMVFSEAPPVPRNAPVIVTAKHSGLVFDVTGGSKDKGAKLIQYGLHNGDNQIFVFEPQADEYFSIRNVKSGLYLDIQGGSTDTGAQVIQWNFHGGDNQLFSVEPLPNGYYHIISKKSGLNLAVAGGSTDNSAGIIQDTPQRTANSQMFHIGANNVIVVTAENQDEAIALIRAYQEKYGIGNVKVEAAVDEQEIYSVLYVSARAGEEEDGILFVVSAEAQAAVFHVAEGSGIQTAAFDVLQVKAKASAGFYNGVELSASLISLQASVFDLNLGFGISTGVGIKDDSLDFKVAGVGFTIGRKISISVFDNSFGVDFGRCSVM